MEVAHCPPTLLSGTGAMRCFGYRGRLAEPRVRQLVPSGGVRLIVRFGDPLRSASGTSGPVPTTAQALVVGPTDSPGQTTHAGEVHSLQLQLTPLGAYRLLGVPMRELSGLAVDLADVLGPQADELFERLASTSSWDARFRLLGTLLGTRAAAARHQPDPAVAWAWRRLSRSCGRVPVDALATEIGVSRRHLSRRFHDQVGLPPKRAARLLRFRRAIRLQSTQPHWPWHRVAAECGYYDHAHLTTEFRTLAGCTPTEYLTRSARLAPPH